MSAIFDDSWRENHAKLGDRALKNASDFLTALGKLDGMPVVQGATAMANVHALAAIAQAHYAAALIPARNVEPS